MARRFELWEYAHDGNGKPVEGATLEFFVGGTSFTTPKDVFSDDLNTTPILQPILSDAAGRWPDIFMDSALYDVRATVGSVVLTRSNYDPGLGAGFGVSSVVGVAQGGTGANNPAQARANLGAASQDAMSGAQDDITELQQQIAPGLNGDNELGTLAARDDVSRDQLASGFGTVVVQTVDATPYTANATLSTTIPLDDTVPLVSEGDEILTASIVPLSSSNKVRIRFDGFGTPSGTNSCSIALLFRGSTCIYALATGQNTLQANMGFTFVDSPNTTSPVTYSIRVGAPTGASGIRMNGLFSGRLFGGSASCTMRLEELEAH